ncbi:MAG: hypothetical protein QXR48_04305 [Candidatus Woesearchaeota archaeon]
MKKFATISLLVALFALLAVSVSAVQLGDVTIGGEEQDRVKNASQTFTITNNETYSVTWNFASTADAKYNVRFDPATVTIPAGQSAQVKVIADIPLDFNAVEPSKSASDYLEKKAFKIGDIQVKSGSTVVATSALKMQAVNQLSIKKVRIACGDSSAKSVDDGEKVKNLKPDTQCTLEVEVENKFDEDDDEYDDGSDMHIGDIEMDTVTVKAVVDDSDFDVSEDEDIDGLDADDKDSVTIEFDIPYDVDDGTYTMVITAYGKDENGAVHGEQWEIRLDVTRLSHDIQIRSPSISPSTISACEGGTVRVVTRIANFGTRDEDDVAVELNVPDLKYTKKITDIELDSDDSTSVSFVVDVPAKSKPGIYRATLSTFFDNTAPSNSQALEFTVAKCEEPEVVVVPTQQQNATVAAPQTGSQQVTPTTGGAVAVPRARVTSTSGFADSTAYLWLLGGAGLVLLLIIIILLVVAFRKPRQEVL